MRRSRCDKKHSPLTFGQALKAGVRIMTWCEQCRHSFEPDTAGLVERYGATTTVINWAKRLRCSKCGGRATFIVSGSPR
jgi:Zn finger protein HypA/HybF involved in hydrogenase expression